MGEIAAHLMPIKNIESNILDDDGLYTAGLYLAVNNPFYYVFMALQNH
jgi:protein-S-isoprenylcysteine O-methyltransferase Ste14